MGDRTDSIIGFGIVTFLIIIALVILYPKVDAPKHEHEVYTRTWANGHRSTEFIVCQTEKSIVTASGKHWGFIPNRLDRIIKNQEPVRFYYE